MTIRKIITTSALVVLLGLSGGSAYATDDDSHLDDRGFTVAANASTSGAGFVYENDYDVYEGYIPSTDGYEEASLPEHILETLNTN